MVGGPVLPVDCLRFAKSFIFSPPPQFFAQRTQATSPPSGCHSGLKRRRHGCGGIVIVWIRRCTVVGIIMRTSRINSNSQIPAKRKNSTFFLSPAELGETLLYIYFIVFAHHVPSIRHIPQQYTQQAEARTFIRSGRKPLLLRCRRRVVRLHIKHSNVWDFK